VGPVNQSAQAIYEGADDWRYKDGTKLSGKVILPDGTEVDSDDAQTPISDEVYIVPGKCTECKGFHDEPQCAAVCPVDCCILMIIMLKQKRHY
jgi:ferredoxin